MPQWRGFQAGLRRVSRVVDRRDMTDEYEPPDITYIKMALDGFAKSGPECRMVKPHIADYLDLSTPVPVNPEELLEPATEALRREFPKLIAELAIYKRELEQAQDAFAEMMRMPVEFYTAEADALIRLAYNHHKAISDNRYTKLRASRKLQYAGTMLGQDD